jgi:hypothetical protein
MSSIIALTTKSGMSGNLQRPRLISTLLIARQSAAIFQEKSEAGYKALTIQEKSAQGMKLQISTIYEEELGAQQSQIPPRCQLYQDL